MGFYDLRDRIRIDRRVRFEWVAEDGVWVLVRAVNVRAGRILPLYVRLEG